MVMQDPADGTLGPIKYVKLSNTANPAYLSIDHFGATDKVMQASFGLTEYK